MRAGSTWLLAFALGVVTLVATALPARALAPLHVTALSQRTDRDRVPAGEAFHVVIHVHFTEAVGNPAGIVVLPDLTDLVNLGDERRASTGPQGTDYYETLTLAGIRAGTAHLTPAYVDALDPKTGAPIRYSSNTLDIRISGERLDRSSPFVQAIWGIVWRVVVGFGLLILALAGLAAFARRSRRARADAVYAPFVPSATPVPPPVPPNEAIRRAIEMLRVSRTRENAVAVRAALFAQVGASSSETLSDVLSRLRTDDDRRRALRAAERAAFIGDDRLQSAIEDLLDVLERRTGAEV